MAEGFQRNAAGDLIAFHHASLGSAGAIRKVSTLRVPERSERLYASIRRLIEA
jgi:hypothetical protein